MLYSPPPCGVDIRRSDICDICMHVLYVTTVVLDCVQHAIGDKFRIEFENVTKCLNSVNLIYHMTSRMKV